MLTGSLGGDPFMTSTYFNTASGSAPGSFSGWMTESFKFTANSTSELLSFLAVGTPSGNVPPFALLDGVSLTAVPAVDIGDDGHRLRGAPAVPPSRRRRPVPAAA